MAGLSQWFSSVQGQARAATSQAGLQAIVDQSYGALSGLTDGMGEQLGYLAGFAGLVTFDPASLPDAISFITGFQTNFLATAFAPYATLVAQVGSVTAALDDLTSVVTDVAAENGWDVSIPTVTVPAIPPPSPSPTPTPTPPVPVLSVVLTATENLAADALVSFWASGVRNANATDNTKPAGGFVTAAVASGSPATVYLAGLITLSSLTPGAPYYLGISSGTATASAPSSGGNLVQQVGIAASATQLVFNPQPGITL